MTPTRQHIQTVAKWLADLADLTAGTVPLPDAKTKIAALSLILAEEYPQAAFTRPSLTEVARHCKYFPSFAEICTHLTAWWRENQPYRPAIAGGGGCRFLRMTGSICSGVRPR